MPRKKRIEEHEVTWDTHPQYQMFQHKKYEFFRRGNLAKALNRQITTIRAMERKGVICLPRLQSPRKQWLYTRDQIEDLVRLAEEEGVLYPNDRHPFSDRFITVAHEILNRIPE